MSHIKILRLKTGEDIIGFIEPMKEKKGVITIRYPTVLLVQYDFEKDQQELLMKFWLPTSLIQKNAAIIATSEILVVMEVKKDFEEYYLNYLNDFSKISDIDEEETLDRDEMFKNLLEVIDTKALGKPH
jgi:hypothetical protein